MRIAPSPNARIAAGLLLAVLLSVVGYQVVRRLNSHGPEALLKRADDLSWLNSWIQAEPLYRQAEQEFIQRHQLSKALYARVSQVPAKSESSASLPTQIAQLRDDLTLPEAKDPETHLRILTILGMLEVNYDSGMARRTWSEVETLANQRQHYLLVSRASGEQGIAAFLLGDIATAKKKVVRAWLAAKAFDPGAHIRYASLYGAGLVEMHKYQEALGPSTKRLKSPRKLKMRPIQPLPAGVAPRNLVDDQVQWLKATPNYRPEMEREYRFARSLEQVRVAEELRELHSTAGILIVDAQGHGIISAKIASTVHDAFHALMLAELDRYGRVTPMLLENINLRLAQSVSARNALEKEGSREIATMIYGEIRSNGQFRFANFGHPPPLVFSAESRSFKKINDSRMMQLLPLGLQIPADHPDRERYYSLTFRQTEFNSSDIDEITLMSPGDILFLYTDGTYDGTGRAERDAFETIMREHCGQSAREICNGLLDFAAKKDARLRQGGDSDLIDDKTVFIVKRT